MGVINGSWNGSIVGIIDIEVCHFHGSDPIGIHEENKKWSIALYRQVVQCYAPIIWWKFAMSNAKLVHICKIMVMLLTGNGNLRAIEAKQSNVIDKKQHAQCKACGSGDENL